MQQWLERKDLIHDGALNPGQSLVDMGMSARRFSLPHPLVEAGPAEAALTRNVAGDGKRRQLHAPAGAFRRAFELGVATKALDPHAIR
jgi:hypothetical protein